MTYVHNYNITCRTSDLMGPHALKYRETLYHQRRAARPTFHRYTCVFSNFVLDYQSDNRVM